MAMLVPLYSPALQAQDSRGKEASFSVQPTHCVALNQGRKCFANIKLKWQAQSAGNYCIVQKTDSRVLQCWQNSQASLSKYEFESDKKIVYQLIHQDSREIIAETEVNVSWVHKSTPRKRRWRLF